MPSLRRAWSVDVLKRSLSGQSKVLDGRVEVPTLEEDELLCGDLELSQHGPSGRFGHGKRCCDDIDTPEAAASGCDLHRILALCRPSTSFEAQLLRDVRTLKPACTTPDGGFSVQQLASRLTGLGYLVEPRSSAPAEGAAAKQAAYGKRCLENLHHVSIRCTGSLHTYERLDLVVEPRFREQFQIAHPTTSYETLVKAVSEEFVGTHSRLHALVELLCAKIADAFVAQRRSLPPWRKTRSMLSKWFPGGDPSPQRARSCHLPPPVGQLGPVPDAIPAHRPSVRRNPRLDDSAHLHPCAEGVALPLKAQQQAPTGRPRVCIVPQFVETVLPGRLGTPAVAPAPHQPTPLPPHRHVVALNAMGTLHAQLGGQHGAAHDAAAPLPEAGHRSGAVSLLARGLASMKSGGAAPGLAPAVAAASGPEAAAAAKGAKLRRTSAWGMGSIHTVRRMGKAAT